MASASATATCAKFVEASGVTGELGNDACTTLPLAGGSVPHTVEEGKASQIRFPRSSPSPLLCYSFVGEPFQLYEEIDVLEVGQDLPASYENKRGLVNITLDLPFTMAGAEGTSIRSDFVEQFRKEVATAMGIAISRVRVIAVYQGSIIVNFVIDPIARP